MAEGGTARRPIQPRLHLLNAGIGKRGLRSQQIEYGGQAAFITRLRDVCSLLGALQLGRGGVEPFEDPDLEAEILSQLRR